MSRDPVVSIMIPSYNYAKFLTEAVESAVRQEGADVEVVIVENGSTDGSREIAMQLSESYSNVRVIVYDTNKGLIASLNRCRDAVVGEYAVMLCADDCLVPGSIARSVAFMEDHPTVGMVYGPAYDFTKLHEVPIDDLDKRPGKPIFFRGHDWVSRRCRLGTNPIRTPEVLMRQSALVAAGKYLESCPHASDLYMWLRIAAFSDVAFLPGPIQALYRRHGGMQSNLHRSTVMSDLEERWAAFAAFFATIDGQPERLRWERDVRRALAREARYFAARFYGSSQPQSHSRPEDLLCLAQQFDDRTSWPESLGWALRHRLGPTRASKFPGFLPRRAMHRLHVSNQEHRRLSRGG